MEDQKAAEQGVDQEVEEEEEEEKQEDMAAHRRRKSSVLQITHSAKSSYMASLSTGVYGNYYYQSFRTLHDSLPEESKMESAESGFKDIDGGLHSVTSKFVLQYAVDNDEEIENLLSENEREKIVEFQNLLSSRYNYENIAYSELVRYVIGTKLRVEVAQRRFLNLKKREQEYALYDVALHQVRDELKKPCYLLCGRGLQGATIVGFSIRKWSRKEMDISVMMKSLMVWVDAISTDLGVCRNGIVILFDMNGLNKENLSLDLEKVFIKAFQDCYPLRIRQFLVVDAPIIVRGALQLGKLVLSKKLSSRIMSVKSTEGTGTLWNHVHSSQVPPCIGGTYNEANDGTQPSNAWQFVCSKVVGDNADDLAMDQRDDSDREYMKKKSLQFEQGQQDTGSTKKEMGRQMLRRLSAKAKTGGTMIKSGVSKAKSGVTSAASASSKGINAAKTKIKEKREERRAKKHSKDVKGGDNDENANAEDDGDDDLIHKKTKGAQRKSFSKRSEYVAKKEDNGHSQDTEEKGTDDANEVAEDNAVEEEVTEKDDVKKEEIEKVDGDSARGDDGAQNDTKTEETDAKETAVSDDGDVEQGDSVQNEDADTGSDPVAASETNTDVQ